MNRLQSLRGGVPVVVATAALVASLAFATAGGFDVAQTGAALTLAVLIVTAAFGRAAYTGTLARPFSGSTALLLMTLLCALSAVSVGWSVLPGASSIDATRTISYTAILAFGALAAQLLPRRSREVGGGLLLAALVICVYALLSRIVPGWFPASDASARLRLPFEYWNAVGAVGAFGLISSLWLGSAREIKPWLIALSFPAGALFLVVLALSQSRGSMAAAVVGVALWLALAPRRLRATLWLACVGFVGALVVAWAYAQPALSEDFIALAERESTGRTFALILALMIIALGGAGYGIERWRRDTGLRPNQRYALGRVLLVALALSPFVFIGAVAVGSDKGVSTISDSVNELFNADVLAAPANSPERLTQTNSLRARYWSDAFKIWGDHRLHGTGGDTYSVARLPYRVDTLRVNHAHGYVPQTLADWGLWGLALMIALTVAFVIAFGKAAAAKAIAPWRWLESADDNRLADLGIAIVAVAFAAHSALDWTWYIPGVAVFGLVSAGWMFGSAHRLSGRTEKGERVSPTPTTRALRASGIALIGLAAAFAVYQPSLAARKVDNGFERLAAGNPAEALNDGRDAHDADPTSDKPYYLIAAAYDDLKQPRAADQTLARVASIQPTNPETWIRLADYRLNQRKDPKGAIEALKALLFISPNNERGNALLEKAKQQRINQLLEEQIEAESRRIKRKIAKLRRETAALGIPAAPVPEGAVAATN
ncbi:MAG: O-antigen ligase family protein [Solirubrobacterales bacterium]